MNAFLTPIRWSAIVLLSLFLLCNSASAQRRGGRGAPTADSPDGPPTARPTTSSDAPIDRIRDEGINHSQVMQTLSYLTDVIGPRLTGSPILHRANEWTRDTLTKWGLEYAHLEAWGPFGRGWSVERFSAQVVEPQCIPLIA